MKTIFEEMIETEEGFEIEHQETEYIYEVNGVTVCEQLEDFLERENMVDDEEVDVITDHLDEIGQLEMEAELAMGI